MRDTKDKQISELKKMIEDSNETQRNEYEKRVCQHLSHACFCFCFLLFIPQLVWFALLFVVVVILFFIVTGWYVADNAQVTNIHLILLYFVISKYYKMS